MGLASLLTLQGLHWSCPCDRQQMTQSHTELRAIRVAADRGQSQGRQGSPSFLSLFQDSGSFAETPIPCLGVLRAPLQPGAEGARIMQQMPPAPTPLLTPLSPMCVFTSVSNTLFPHHLP